MFVQEFKKEDLILFPVSLHSYGRSNRDSEQKWRRPLLSLTDLTPDWKTERRSPHIRVLWPSTFPLCAIHTFIYLPTQCFYLGFIWIVVCFIFCVLRHKTMLYFTCLQQVLVLYYYYYYHYKHKLLWFRFSAASATVFIQIFEGKVLRCRWSKNHLVIFLCFVCWNWKLYYLYVESISKQNSVTT